ncbi:hypothetical protein D3C86_1897660 [compost metagenome]
MLRADQHQATSSGQQQQQVHLFAVARIALAGRFTPPQGCLAQVGVGQGYAGQSGGQHQCHVVAGEVVHQQQWGDLQRRDPERRNDRQQGQVEAEHREHEGQAVVTLPGDGQHHHDDRGADDQQR